VKARKAAAREERRIARRQRRADGPGGADDGFGEGAAPDAEDLATGDDSTSGEIVDLREPAKVDEDTQPAELEKEGH
jgi:hypothetical protein